MVKHSQLKGRPVDMRSSDPDAVKALAINTIRNVIKYAFSTMAGLDASVGPEYMYRPPLTASRSVAGVIGWVGNWNGTGIIDCTPEFACHLANQMLGTSTSTLSEDSLDALAEMTNIIFGGMKTELEGSLGWMGLSTPTVIYGNNVGMRSAGEAFTALPIQIAEHALSAKIYMVQVEQKKHSVGNFWAGACTGAL
jgi:CheY-specific phosphatase CheX